MTKPQIIRTETGEELVVLSRREYDELLSRLDDEAAEDAALARLSDARADELGLPESVWEAIEAAPSPVGPLRKWRELTQKELAERAEITQGYLSEIEAGKKTGDLSTLRAIARALDVPVENVMPEEEEPKPRKPVRTSKGRVATARKTGRRRGSDPKRLAG